MSKRPKQPYVGVLFAAALIAILWTAAGVYGLFQRPLIGYVPDADYVVQQTVPGSAAVAAGLRAGDRIITVDGEDPRTAATPIRRHIGQPLVFEIERDGTRQSLHLRVGGLPRSQRVGGLVNALIGLTFLATGLATYVRIGNPQARLLAVLGVSCAVVFAAFPITSSRVSLAFFGWTATILTLLATAVFAHFTLLYPKPHRLAERTGVLTALYTTTALAVLAMPVRLLAPTAIATQIATGGAFVVVWQQRLFLLLALALLTLSFVRSPRSHRKANGLSALLVGTVLSVVPYLILMTLAMGNPNFPVPPGLALLAMPLALGYAVHRASQFDTVESTSEPRF